MSTFESIRSPAARYFGLPVGQIYFMDCDHQIYMNDMDLRESLFPMLQSRLTSHTPTIYLTLQKNRSVIENLVGGEEERANLALIEAEQKKLL